MIGLKRGIVKLAPYDKAWPKEFEQEKKKLVNVLGSNVVSIEHVGSTSIPGLVAKPIIDVLIGVKTIKKQGKSCIKVLSKKAGYYERQKYFPKIRFLVAKGDEDKRTYYIHIVKYGGGIWKRSIAFRDYLRKHDNVTKKYAELKKELASQYGDSRVSYTAKKSKFIKDVIKKSR